MIFVDNQNTTDPRINLAIEEHLLRNLDIDQEILLFYINEPSIIIGRNQNTLEEINHKNVEERGIQVVRRLSGGGAVYHDFGNLNFSFIAENRRENLHNFAKFTAPVIQVLREMGVPAELRGRNDIVVEGRKISGNAQYIAAQRMVSHGTLLFDSNLDHVTEALNVKMGKITSKGIKSIRSRVANISEFLETPMDIKTFRSRLLQGIFSRETGIPEYRLNEGDWESIRKIAAERYCRWEWNYGRSPDFNVQKTERFPFGEVDARIEVERGEIRKIKFFGDFLGFESISDLEDRLIGVRYAPEDLYRALDGLDMKDYFGGLTAAELVDFLY